jgi:hypothetical protein
MSVSASTAHEENHRKFVNLFQLFTTVLTAWDCAETLARFFASLARALGNIRLVPKDLICARSSSAPAIRSTPVPTVLGGVIECALAQIPPAHRRKFPLIHFP